MISQCSMKGPGRPSQRWQHHVDRAVSRLVSTQSEIGSDLGVVPAVGDMPATIFKSIDCHRVIIGCGGTRGALYIKLRLADSRHVALDESGFASIIPAHVDVDLIGVRDVAPDTFVRDGTDPLRSALENAQDPVDVS